MGVTGRPLQRLQRTGYKRPNHSGRAGRATPRLDQAARQDSTQRPAQADRRPRLMSPPIRVAHRRTGLMPPLSQMSGLTAPAVTPRLQRRIAACSQIRARRATVLGPPLRPAPCPAPAPITADRAQ